MGSYDYLDDGEISKQVKCFDNIFKHYNPGDKVPADGSFIIVLPEHEIFRFALVKDGTYIGLTDCFAIIDKWGQRLDSIEDFVNPFVELVQSFDTKVNE